MNHTYHLNSLKYCLHCNVNMKTCIHPFWFINKNGLYVILKSHICINCRDTCKIWEPNSIIECSMCHRNTILNNISLYFSGLKSTFTFGVNKRLINRNIITCLACYIRNKSKFATLNIDKKIIDCKGISLNRYAFPIYLDLEFNPKADKIIRFQRLRERSQLRVR